MKGLLAGYFTQGAKRQFSTGEIVLRGEESSGVFYIDRGFIKVYSISDQGNKYVHIIYKSGEIFPLVWMFIDVKRRIFYETLGPATLYEIPKAKFLKDLRSDASLSYELLAYMANQFSIYADRLDNLQYKSAYERVVYRILFLASRFGVKKDGAIVINAPITHEIIAESVNLARESASRQVEKLERLGLVKYRKGQITIKDVSKLSEQFSEPASLDLWGLGK